MGTAECLQDAAPKPHLIFLVNGCTYLRQGLEFLMAEAGCQSLILPVTEPEEILAWPVSRYGRRLVLVSLPPEPVQAARGRFFLWRLEVLRMQGVRTGPLLCLLDGDRGRWNTQLAGYRWLPSGEGLSAVQKILPGLLNSPKMMAPLPVIRNCRLSRRQQYILRETLAGGTVKAMAEELEISELAVFSARTALMTKMGLNNRLELMSLAGTGNGCY
ncbi:helix-turn-helix transcriptional regulator [Salmonella enterica subsp. enterica serovar Rubislaw]|nr:helix-turn-helix transcriptional regulator [Salmonella enterica]ELE3222545.1 helix-turn-helix transcriptional regulator [Salmonella enterica subsp. enterica serovar Rubislaw]ELO3942402.1 helix-turn-helix transcriptional regulator [Salmonella enterica]ELU8881656.1 helix-turn-helix transcriptional regulator [Salmonella enterica]